LPDDWDQRVRAAGAVAFRSTPSRETTLANLRQALAEDRQSGALFELPAEKVAPFFGVGFGYGMVEALYEAMEHENLIPAADLLQDVQKALEMVRGEGGTFTDALKAAAEKLQTAREVLYPTTLYLLDLALLDETYLADPFPASFALDLPCNLIASASLLEN